ncbi:MAG TPA: hypothetical protein V6C97_26500 [Oculatellaceae cyanobacterium]
MIPCDPMPRHTPEEYRTWTKRYEESRKTRGDKRVGLWCPEDRVEELKAFAAKLRAESDVKGKRPSKTPRVVVPKLEIPEAPPPGWAYLRIDEDELALRMVVKANGGQWINGGPERTNKTWKLRSDLVDKLGLCSRVVHERST